jgi:ATP-dependent RNA helicase DeaD
MDLPSVDAVNASRISKFKLRISETVARGKAAEFRPILRELEAETGMPLIDIAAALASLGQGESSLLLKGAETHRPGAESLPETKPRRGKVRGNVRDVARGSAPPKFRRRTRH